MKRYILLLIIVLASAFSGFAQIEEEITLSKKVKIENGRAYLIEKLIDRDYGKVKEIKDYLKILEDDNYCAFYPWELWQILYWTSEFDELSVEFGVDSTDFHALDTKVLPVKDQLNQQLYQHSVEDEHILRSNLQEAGLNDEDYEFFSIFLDWNLKPLSSENQKIVNEKLDKFLADYPNTRYEWVAKNIIHKPYYDRSDWGLGVSFELCSGFSTGQMHKPVGGFGVSFNASYKKLELDLGGNIIAANTRYNITYSGDSIYSKGSEIDFTLLYANLSYNIVDNKSIRLSPVVGVGYNWESFSTSKKKRINNKYVLYQVGLNLDIKLTHNVFDDHYIRIRYNCGITNMGQSEISTLHVISVGWTGFSNRKLVK